MYSLCRCHASKSSAPVLGAGSPSSYAPPWSATGWGSTTRAPVFKRQSSRRRRGAPVRSVTCTRSPRSSTPTLNSGSACDRNARTAAAPALATMPPGRASNGEHTASCRSSVSRLTSTPDSWRFSPGAARSAALRSPVADSCTCRLTTITRVAPFVACSAQPVTRGSATSETTPRSYVPPSTISPTLQLPGR